LENFQADFVAVWNKKGGKLFSSLGEKLGAAAVVPREVICTAKVTRELEELKWSTISGLVAPN
jgi:hypothetical protein